MVKKIVDAVIIELIKRLKKEMSKIDAKLDDIDKRLANIEVRMELRDIKRDFDFLLSKHSAADVTDVLNPDPVDIHIEGRRPGL